MKTSRALSVALVCALGACADDPPPKVEAEPVPSQQPALPAAAEPEPTAEQVPIVEDFEEQAAAEIKEENLSAQLDAIEQEIELDAK